MLKIFSVVSIKGGVSKTVISVNVAGCLSKMFPESDIIIIDLDPQGNSSEYLGLSPKDIDTGTKTLFEDKDVELVDCMYTANYADNLFIIPSEISLNNTELAFRLGEIQTDLDHNKILKEKIERFKENSIRRDTIIILDVHPDFNMFTINALMAADRIITPVNPCKFSMRGFEMLMANISYIREKENRKLRSLGVVRSNWCKANTNIVKTLDCQINEEFEPYIFDTIISSSINVEKTKMDKIPLIFSDCKNSKITKEFISLSKEILDRWNKVIR